MSACPRPQEKSKAELEKKIGIFQEIDQPDESLTAAQVNDLVASPYTQELLSVCIRCHGCFAPLATSVIFAGPAFGLPERRYGYTMG